MDKNRLIIIVGGVLSAVLGQIILNATVENKLNEREAEKENKNE